MQKHIHMHRGRHLVYLLIAHVAILSLILCRVIGTHFSTFCITNKSLGLSSVSASIYVCMYAELSPWHFVLLLLFASHTLIVCCMPHFVANCFLCTFNQTFSTQLSFVLPPPATRVCSVSEFVTWSSCSRLCCLHTKHWMLCRFWLSSGRHSNHTHTLSQFLSLSLSLCFDSFLGCYRHWQLRRTSFLTAARDAVLNCTLRNLLAAKFLVLI